MDKVFIHCEWDIPNVSPEKRVVPLSEIRWFSQRTEDKILVELRGTSIAYKVTGIQHRWGLYQVREGESLANFIDQLIVKM